MTLEEGSVDTQEPAGMDIESVSDSIGEDLFPSNELEPEQEKEVKLEPEVKSEPEAKSEQKPETSQPATNPPPKTWRPDALLEWEKLSPTVQAEVLKREEDMFKGLEGYKAEAIVGRELKTIIAPYEEVFKQHNVNPMQTMQGLLQAHMVMSTGTPEQKQAVFQQIVSAYGLQNPEDAPYIDPQISSLQNKINQLESQLMGFTNQSRVAQLQQTKSEVDSFAADPKNAYFDDVASDIAQLLKSGVAKSLPEAYEKAIWANPVTRAKETARLLTESEAAKQLELDKKTEEAKAAAAANVKTSHKRGGSTAAKGTMDDTLQETLAKINSRK